MRKLETPIIKPEEYPSFDNVINVARQEFLKDHAGEFSERYNTGQYTAGVRFKSNEDVLIRIISACPTREAFEQNKAAWILSGLEECAAADYYYTFEKDWGVHEVVAEPEEDDDGDLRSVVR